jgi:hypothetical protein
MAPRDPPLCSTLRTASRASKKERRTLTEEHVLDAGGGDLDQAGLLVDDAGAVDQSRRRPDLLVDSGESGTTASCDETSTGTVIARRPKNGHPAATECAAWTAGGPDGDVQPLSARRVAVADPIPGSHRSRSQHRSPRPPCTAASPRRSPPPLPGAPPPFWGSFSGPVVRAGRPGAGGLQIQGQRSDMARIRPTAPRGAGRR